MSQKIYGEISMSLDGFSAGPNDSPTNPMGDNGDAIHEWMFQLQGWREEHGLAGGVESVDNAQVEEYFKSVGAWVMGRRMFDHGLEPWGETPPFHGPVFVVTHRPHAPIDREGGTTYHFVGDGLESAIAQARAAAGDRNVNISGGASILRQTLQAGLVDRLKIHVTPVLLGGGVRLFDDTGVGSLPGLPFKQIVSSAHASHFIFERE